MNTDQLSFIPPEMTAWNLQLITPEPSQFGEYALVDIRQAGIETHHQVEVIDEDGKPLRGVWVIFGFGSGPSINMPTRKNYWRDAPTALKGNAQRTNAMGYAQHTFGEGGEDIWVWDRDKNGDLLFPSAIVRNCTWQRTPVARFEHTGILATFQRRQVGVIPQADRIAAVEALAKTLNERLQALEGRVTTLDNPLM